MAVSANALRRQITACQSEDSAESTWSRSPSVIHAESGAGHGNFIAASYRRIVANPEWTVRLAKTYTASARVPRQHDRWRGELECANSSDALLMNIFCYPRVTARPALARLLGVDEGARPSFGVRAHLAMRNGEVDRTELDMTLGDLAVEAKLTEGSFGAASRERAMRYSALAEVFELEELPWTGRGLAGYQLVRGVLAAHAEDRRFLLLCDGRRADLQETWFGVLRAVRSAAVRSRMALLTWQELAQVVPKSLQGFLRTHYGITPP